MLQNISYKNIWKIALPIIISGVAQNVVTVTDTMFLGRLGNVELGAAGNAGILYFLLVLSGMGFTTGAQIIIGRRNGEQNFTQIGKVFDHCIYFIHMHLIYLLKVSIIVLQFFFYFLLFYLNKFFVELQ